MSELNAGELEIEIEEKDGTRTRAVEPGPGEHHFILIQTSKLPTRLQLQPRIWVMALTYQNFSKEGATGISLFLVNKKGAEIKASGHCILPCSHFLFFFFFSFSLLH